ncbi:hypothetical protein H5410_008242 [Solanum commersonii]|uniref:LRAT domain-containing protein n=1 Tax=Solanum commersonii TaxID=4109 RepID=A0A9J6AEM8_SOLCO|nr:hypothetical protein H5410_008242 [Solanum commersonii]
MSESSRWTMPEIAGILSNKIPQDELKPGDHIYSWRNAYLYAHHGQEIGTGTVLDRFIFSSSPSHPSGSPCPRCGDQSRTEGVISSCLEGFIAKTSRRACTIAPSDPPEHVLHRAKFLLQNGFGIYNIFKNNCEDLQSTARLAVGADNILLAATTAIVSSPLRFLTTGVSGLAAVGFGVYCVSRYVSDIGVRRDVMKIPVERLILCPGPLESEAATITDTSKDKGL